MEETSVLAKGKSEKAAASASSAGGQSVLNNNKGPKKPVTFYKKAWFWIIIAVVVLGIAGLIVFLVIQANITAEAIEKYNKSVKTVDTAVSDYRSTYSNIYSESGLAGYLKYDDDSNRSAQLMYKCLEEFDVSSDIFKAASDIETYDGEIAVDKYGAGKTRELAEKFEKATEGLKNAKADVKGCKKILARALKEDYKISFGDFTVIKKTYWDDTELEVTVKNTSDTSLDFSFEIEAQDSNGNKIDSDYFYTRTLSAGQSVTKKIFEYVSDSDVEAMKTATFVVKKVSES